MAVKDYIRGRFFPHIWCPGCGHGTVLNGLLRALDGLGINKNNVVMVSGIRPPADLCEAFGYSLVSVRGEPLGVRIV